MPQYQGSGRIQFLGPVYNFYYEGGGRLRLCSRTTVKKTATILTKFKERDTAWDKAKARKGLLRKVTVKSLYLVSNTYTGGAVNILYIDTFNSMWNERDLINHGEAVALATAYWQRVADQTSAAIQELDPPCR